MILNISSAGKSLELPDWGFKVFVRFGEFRNSHSATLPEVHILGASSI